MLREIGSGPPATGSVAALLKTAQGRSGTLLATRNRWRSAHDRLRCGASEERRRAGAAPSSLRETGGGPVASGSPPFRES
ncbi:MAG TPA: hypothetical protein VGG72_11440, partial [Bryobacteraceae bacterium]